jgi:predicted RNase H-like HicB family nuclease
MKYGVVIEKGENSYGAYVPDLPGCVAAAETLAEVKALISEAVQFHIGACAGRAYRCRSLQASSNT